MRSTASIFLALSLFSSAAITAPGSEARQKLAKGIASYDAEDYGGATSSFEEAAELAKDTGLDPAVAVFNEANAHLAGGEPARAIETYESALRTGNLDLQSRVYFNQGNAHMATVDAQLQEEQMEPAMEAVSAALESYERAVVLDQDDIDAKANYELAWLKRRQIQELMQQQQQRQSAPSDDEQSEPQEGDDQQQQQRPQDDDGEDDQERQNDQPGQDEQQPPPQDDPSEGQQPQPQPASEEMTPEEAQILLESMKEQEAAKREQMRLRLGQPVPVEKDW